MLPLLQSLIRLIDMVIFLLIAAKGLSLIWIGGGGYIIFWGCALVCTAVYWKTLDKGFILDSIKDFFTRLKR